MNKQICPACQGRKAIQAGNVTLGCPFCAGEGTVEDVDRKPFWYVVNPPAAIGAAGVVNVPLNIDARADFELFCLVATSTGAFTCEITESAESAAWIWPSAGGLKHQGADATGRIADACNPPGEPFSRRGTL